MTKERIAQSKRAGVGSLVIVDYYSHNWRELVSFGCLICSDVMSSFSCVVFVFFVSFSSFLLLLKPQPSV